jgi:hypothetical protein
MATQYQLDARLRQLQRMQKQGRVLSSDNEADLIKANDLVDQAGELIEGVLEQVTGQPVVEPADEGPDTGTPSAASYGRDDEIVSVNSRDLLDVINRR